MVTQVGLCLLLAGCGPGFASPQTRPSSAASAGHQTRRVLSAETTPKSTFNLHAHSTSDPSSIWVVVNKKHPIKPLDYVPDLTIVRGYQVAVAAAPELRRLLHAADRAELGFKIASAYRSYGYQLQVHDELVAAHGQAYADHLSARPGYSEHQTGLAVDLVTPASPACDFRACFTDTPGGRWLRLNSWRFGFIVRYTQANRVITGYASEPWHLRYVGRALARQMHSRGVATLEQMFGIAGGGYRS